MIARPTFSCTLCELESEFRKLRHASVVFLKSFSQHLCFLNLQERFMIFISYKGDTDQAETSG